MEKRKCLHCGDEFTGKQNKKFCSDSCKSAAHQKKSYAIAKTVTQGEKPSLEMLAQMYPGIPTRLLKTKDWLVRMEGLKRTPYVKNNGFDGAIENFTRPMQIIFDCEMQIEEKGKDSDLDIRIASAKADLILLDLKLNEGLEKLKKK